jgi:hypothetical protein
VLGCGLALSATSGTFNLFKLILQRGFQLIQLGQLAVKCFNFSGQLAFFSFDSVNALIIFRFKIIEFCCKSCATCSTSLISTAIIQLLIKI